MFNDSMINEPDQSLNQNSNQTGLLWNAKRFIQNLNWLSPISALASKGGREFGRGIEASLNEVATKRGVMLLTLRKRDTAVVMSVGHYEEMVRMKALCAQLVERVKEKEIANEADEYEALYQRITSPESRDAADTLFSATTDSLRNSYQPGKTES
jgi:hypothetical protein